MKGIIPVTIFATSLQIFIRYAASYNLKCPEQANWKLRAIGKCNSTIKYFCLYNNVYREYVEGCTGPDWDRKGAKRIYSADFTREKCLQTRFQPFRFWTNGSTSDCIYAKSLCSEEGQIVYEDNSTRDDTTCRCDHEKNYSFVKTPRNLCYCIPTEEDCSCYINVCPVNLIFSADYECIRNDSLTSPNCINLTRYQETQEENTGIIIDKDQILSEKNLQIHGRVSVGAIIIVCLCCVVLAGLFVLLAVIFPKSWTRNNFRRQTENGTLKDTEKLIDTEEYTPKDNVIIINETVIEKLIKTIEAVSEDVSTPNKFEMDNPEVIKECVVSDIQRLRKLILDERCVEPKDMNAGDKVDHENNKLCSRTPLATNQIVLKKDEVNYLRMVLLLYRVVRPAVRIYFNHEIEPKLLRKTLKKNLTKMKNIYRKKNHSVINDDQWNLLSRNNPGKTVTSDDFDVRLMIYLLKTITTIKLGDLYPTEVDTSIGAMLSRIKFIRNEITQNLHEKLPVDLFNKYWDDMGQAVLELVSSQIVLNVGDKENTQFIERLLSLNPIHIDIDKLSTFVVMSEIYPAIILRQFISEYCKSKKITIEDLLKNEKDQLYHKRQKTKKCCVCEDDKYAIYIKLLPEKQWEELYEVEECTNQHSISCKIKICSTCVVPKKDLKLNVSVLVSLILYIPEILEYFISHFSDEKFEKILNDDQHTIYHSMKKEKCCKCKKDPTEKIILKKKDWNTLFEKSDIIICKADKGKPCCCQYSVRKGIKKSSMDNILRCKIFDIAGPFGVINKIEQDALLYFLNWTVHDSSLPELLADLRSLISADEIQFHEMLKDIPSSSLFKLDTFPAKRIDTEKWFAAHKRKRTSMLEKRLLILVCDKELWKVKSIQIPTDFDLSKRVRKFEDLTLEENNFLVVFYTLKKIVHPVVKEQLEKTFVNDKSLLDEILQESYYGSHIDGTSTNSRRFPTLYLSEQQRTKRRLPTNDNSEIDLKTMLHILTQRTKHIVSADHSEWKKQLEVINKIRRDIMQSSSGILELERFRDMMNSINKAVLHFGGETHKADILQLVNNKNILAAVRNENQQHCDVLAGSQTGIMSSSSETTETTVISDTSIPTLVEHN